MKNPLSYSILLLIVTTSIGNAEHGNETCLASGCSTHCTLLFDKTLTCWDDTLKYFTQTIAGLSKRYISTQVNIINRMMYENYTINYDQMTEDSFQSINDVEPPDYEDDASAIKSEETIRRLVKTLMNGVQEVVNIFDGQVVNEFDCPMGCEESSHRWQYLFYGSLLANAVLALLIVAFVCVISRRDRVDESEILMPIKKKNRRSTASDNE